MELLCIEMKNDLEYVLALQSGSEKALKLIMELWYSKLFNFAKGYLRDQENVAEVIQDVFLQLWDQRYKLADNTSLDAYLFTLTRNRCIDFIRRERLALQFIKDRADEYAQLTDSFYALSDPVLDDIFMKEFQKEIDSTVSSLPDQCKKVFLMSREKGLKNKEICQILDLSPKTVESHITKALKAIRYTLESKFPHSFNFIMILIKNHCKIGKYLITSD